MPLDLPFRLLSDPRGPCQPQQRSHRSSVSRDTSHALVLISDIARRCSRNHFESEVCRPLLKVGGEIHITLKMAPPYSEWDVPAIAQSAGYVKWRVSGFEFSQFPGYKHRTTLADAKHLDTGSSGAAGKTVTLMFRRTQQAKHGPQGASTKSSLSLQVSAPNGGARDATAAAAHGGNLGDGAVFLHVVSC